MAQLTHLYEPGRTYLITTNLQPRVPLFADPRYAQIAHEDIAFYAAKFQAMSLSHVIMPEHIHWVLCPSPEVDGEAVSGTNNIIGAYRDIGHGREGSDLLFKEAVTVEAQFPDDLGWKPA